MKWEAGIYTCVDGDGVPYLNVRDERQLLIAKVYGKDEAERRERAKMICAVPDLKIGMLEVVQILKS
jgi:hypothetical protein